MAPEEHTTPKIDLWLQTHTEAHGTAHIHMNKHPLHTHEGRSLALHIHKGTCNCTHTNKHPLHTHEGQSLTSR